LPKGHTLSASSAHQPLLGPFQRQRHKLIRDRRRGVSIGRLAGWKWRRLASLAVRAESAARCHQSLAGVHRPIRPWRQSAGPSDLDPPAAASKQRLESWSISGEGSDEDAQGHGFFEIWCW